GRNLIDLYLDSIEHPDMSGAIVGGTVSRTMAGGQKAWVDAGLVEKIYLESKTPIKAGESVTHKIVTTLQEQKAWHGALVKKEASGQGVITPPPLPWQRALAALPKEESATLIFGDEADVALFRQTPYATREKLTIRFSFKEPVHPDLDEQLDALVAPVVPLGKGGSLVIEPTSALVAIDVNAGSATNMTAVNLIAVKEIARQIRLRNLSGILVVDCLKMAARADSSKVMNAMTRAVESDPVQTHVFGMSKLGLLELTRRRQGPPLALLWKVS
ncbi:MAG: ribonuclease E/G, partial [Bdellovibrionales bacterium]